MRWADEVTAAALASLAASGARPELGDAVRLYAHIAAAEHLWLSRIEATPAALAVWPALSLDEARGLAVREGARFAALVGGADEATLGRVVSYRNSAGQDFVNTISDIVTHVAVHGEHHRGQIARLVRAAGGVPPNTDFIQFARRDQGSR
jgi:uncharacterized damage-inducible protein DinB